MIARAAVGEYQGDAMRPLYFHPDIPQYVRDAITAHLETITFSDAYMIKSLNVVPERDFGYSEVGGDYWSVDLDLAIPARAGGWEPGMYPTEVNVRFRVPVKKEADR